MKQVISKDGVAIAYECNGAGAPLVLVHGTASDHTRWDPLLPELTQHFAVYALDRRGRGQSGDSEPYRIEREYEDIVAVAESAGGPVILLGHSYGAICSLEASLLVRDLRKLVLYEPPIPTSATKRYYPGVMESIEEYLQHGNDEEALLTFLREIAEIPQQEIGFLKSLPGWPARVATARTIPREQSGCETYVFDPGRFSHMKTDTLLLLGGDSPSFYRSAIDTLRAALSESKVSVMPGQQHAAMNTAPELFLSELMGFLSE